MALALYHFGLSLYSMRARLALEEKGLPWESRVVDLALREHLEPWYLRINPKGLVPALVDDGEVVCESLVILRHLERKYPGAPLLAPEGPEREEAEAWIARAEAFPAEPLHAALANPLMTRMEKRSVHKMLEVMDRHAEQNPDLAPIYAEKKRAFKERTDVYSEPMSRDEATALLEAELDALERALADRPWLAGERYSLAEVVWTPVLARISLTGQRARLEAPSRPALLRYLAALRSRPSYRSAEVWDRITFGCAVKMAWRMLFVRPRREAPASAGG